MGLCSLGAGPKACNANRVDGRAKYPNTPTSEGKEVSTFWRFYPVCSRKCKCPCVVPVLEATTGVVLCDPTHLEDNTAPTRWAVAADIGQALGQNGGSNLHKSIGAWKLSPHEGYHRPFTQKVTAIISCLGRRSGKERTSDGTSFIDMVAAIAEPAGILHFAIVPSRWRLGLHGGGGGLLPYTSVLLLANGCVASGPRDMWLSWSGGAG